MNPSSIIDNFVNFLTDVKVISMEEFEPFLVNGPPKLQVNVMGLKLFGVIHAFSLLRFLFKPLTKFLVLEKDNAMFLVPFVGNIFTEKSVVMYIVNPLVSVVLVTILLKFWKFSQIICYGCGVGFICNFISWLILYIVSLINKDFTFTICGSLPILIAFTEAIVYASKGKHDVAIFTGMPCEFFWILMVFAIGTFSVSNMSAFISIFVSYLVLVKLQRNIGFPENEYFVLTDFIPLKSQERDEKVITSVIDSLGLTQTQDLSEADRNRRIRALRAIEERLESIQLPQ